MWAYPGTLNDCRPDAEIVSTYANFAASFVMVVASPASGKQFSYGAAVASPSMSK
jgi:hypothetical protein